MCVGDGELRRRRRTVSLTCCISDNITDSTTFSRGSATVRSSWLSEFRTVAMCLEVIFKELGWRNVDSGAFALWQHLEASLSTIFAHWLLIMILSMNARSNVVGRAGQGS